MDEVYYEADETKFVALTKAWYRKKRSWKLLNLLSWVFLLIGAGAILFMTIMAFDPSVPSTAAFVLLLTAGLVLSCLPFCLAYVTKSQAIRHLGKPYTAMCHIFLCSGPVGFQFGYHDRYDCKWVGSMIVHQIAYENIHHVEVDKAHSLFTVVGRTERVEYMDMAEDRIAYRFTNGQFGDMAEFSFFLAFDGEADFFAQLNAHRVDIRYR